jgi:1,4-alpha-glucan branching enzyme
MYAFSEHFVLPLSHDEVVHGKGSLLRKMPGDDWQRLANLRLLYGYMLTQPGKKLLFMGAELATWNEWYHEVSLDWHLLDQPAHAGVARWLADLNAAYRREPALHELDCDPQGFSWIDCNDAEGSTLSYARFARERADVVVVACNFTPVPRERYKLGVPRSGFWRELLNSDAREYGGGGLGNLGGVTAQEASWHGQPCSLEIVLPPLAVVVFAPEARVARDGDAPEVPAGGI